MDFTNSYPQFAAGQPYGHFVPVPPLTPSQTVNSDDFNQSPPERFESFNPNAGFPNFDYQTFNAPPAHQTTFTGPPTPPTHGLFGTGQQQQAQQQLQNRQQQQQQQQAQQQRHSPLSSAASNGPNDVLIKADNSDDAMRGQGGSEDDENVTPAQSRRKAQNRAAQRAFRERKEKHVKDLESKLADLENAQQQASVENQRLKADLQKMSTENEILRATGGTANNSHSPEPLSTGPLSYEPKDFYSSLLKGHNNQSLSHRIAYSDDGEKLFGAAATWDYIINHELFKAGLVNIGEVSTNLNHRAKCDGQGPVFAESTILDAIQLSVASGSDDLL
ncbi:hypothetical protein NLU13_0412 [Sarocladium strictum]|uniref:BZIP domain-containing protein n=1 Tax=Sarocladium strictum TaxID=5046 RepID=A0AA39GQW6_SARSR|nr:hypothetical protein NLU13_0412 [Sarocladium strictum]